MKLPSLKKLNKGFTLIELLVVIGILAILLAIVLIAINPARQFAQANNTQRRSDVNAILNAIHQYAADNSGALPAGITTTATNVSDTGADICALLVSDYLAALPVDPTAGEPVDEAGCALEYDTGYTVVTSATNNRVTVTAPSAELGDVISATR
ncbi:MAG: type II secretion system protein [Pseudomonadales bacterium]|nr:type II secretion system protein [Pseudomonadales bacterium]